MNSNPPVLTTFLLFVASLVSSGCASKKKEVEWRPGTPVSWSDLASHPAPFVQQDYNITLTEPTQGLFPASVGVTRVTVTEASSESGVDSARPLRLQTDPRNEFLQWNRAFDDQMAVSEVFPISEFDLGGRAVSPKQILSALHALHARIGLLYAVNELSPDETEMFGAIYDVAAERPIAFLHAQARSVELTEEERKTKPVDLWKTDSRALVRGQFEKLAHACFRELISRDLPAPVEDASGWRPETPARPVEWPPNRDGAIEDDGSHR